MPTGGLAEKWNAFLRDAPFATHYVTPNYFIDPYVRGERFAVLVMKPDGEIAAVLTGVKTGVKVESGMFSRPQMAFLRGIDREIAAAALLKGLDEIGVEPTNLVEIYAWEDMPEFKRLGMHTRVSNDETSIVMLDLAVGADTVFAGFSQTRRNEIRKAIKQAKLEIKQLETDEELAELYQIHCDWNERKGNIADTFEEMKTAVEQTENRRVFIAKTDGKVIAGSFYRFCPGSVVEYAGNFSMPEFQHLRPNDLIGWHAIKWACESDFTHFSMGGSNMFLRRFGGKILQTYKYRQDRSLFKLNDLRERTLEIGVGAYKRLPVSVRDGMRRILTR